MGNLTDLFEFETEYSATTKIFTMKFEIPEAQTLWSLFDEESVSDIDEKAEKNLLRRFDSLFNSGHFLFLVDWGPCDDDEEFLDIEEAIYKRKPNETLPILGEWNYSRDNRLVSLEWHTPDWYTDKSANICDFDELRNLVKDWYINSF